MTRLTLFLKGNVDVHDSLHSCRVGGALVWNGLNQTLRDTHPHCLARLKHETWTRSDALLQSLDAVPQTLEARDLPWGAYSLASQFSRALFTTTADAIILSIQPDVTTHLMRHKRDGFLFYANEPASWMPADAAWLKSDCENLGLLTVEKSMENLAAIIAKIREHSEAPILIYNLSPIIPGDRVHCYMGIGETFSNRIRKFNLALTQLSEDTGISIVDVDALIARHGAEALKLDAVHLRPDGNTLLAQEVAHILADLGLLDDIANVTKAAQ